MNGWILGFFIVLFIVLFIAVLVITIFITWRTYDTDNVGEYFSGLKLTNKDGSVITTKGEYRGALLFANIVISVIFAGAFFIVGKEIKQRYKRSKYSISPEDKRRIREKYAHLEQNS
jgi:hypothetical protein